MISALHLTRAQDGHFFIMHLPLSFCDNEITDCYSLLFQTAVLEKTSLNLSSQHGFKLNSSYIIGFNNIEKLYEKNSVAVV